MELSHHREGTGGPLVLLHGIGCRWQHFGPVIAALAARHDVLAVDLPGFGGSPALAASVKPTARALAGAVGDFLDRLGLDTAHVAGNSLGGTVALEMARAGRARSVCCLSPAGFWNAPELAWLQASLWLTGALTTRLAPVAPALARTAAGRTLLMGQMAARPWRTPVPELTANVAAFVAAPGWEPTRRAMPANRISDTSGLDRVPVTIAWAQRDRLLLPAQADRALRLLPRAHGVWLRGCGHLPFHDDPEQVARVLLAASALAEGP